MFEDNVDAAVTMLYWDSITNVSELEQITFQDFATSLLGVERIKNCQGLGWA
ncbi:hypothetical protein [Pseudomonas fluorescens]|uniref:hypothetical protein n=1 Tax=Pseudomonas fluorescens TaxID=294 RepID=UPI00160EA8E9|nr:hypothetical protein [Pseudomonas fluorescens]